MIKNDVAEVSFHVFKESQALARTPEKSKMAMAGGIVMGQGVQALARTSKISKLFDQVSLCFGERPRPDQNQ